MVQVHVGNLYDMGWRFVDAWLRAERATAVRATHQRGDVREHSRRLVACDRVVGATNCAALCEGTNASTFNLATVEKCLMLAVSIGSPCLLAKWLPSALIEAAVAAKFELITDAGGSIGSKLCRQVTRFQPTRLVLYEMSAASLLLSSMPTFTS